MFSTQFGLMGFNTTQFLHGSQPAQKPLYMKTADVSGFVVGDKSFQSWKEESWNKVRRAGRYQRHAPLLTNVKSEAAVSVALNVHLCEIIYKQT